MEEIIFHDVNIEHIALVNSWYYDNDSFHVEKLTEEYVDYIVSRSDYYCWVISSNNEFIGRVDFEIEEDKAYISIIIRPDCRRKGYAKKAIQQVINKYANTKIRKVIAGIFHTNEASKQLFSSIGFVPLTQEPDNDGFIYFIFDYKP